MAIHRWRAVVDFYAEERDGAWVELASEEMRAQFTKWFPCGVVEGYPDVYDQDEKRAKNRDTTLDSWYWNLKHPARFFVILDLSVWAIGFALYAGLVGFDPDVLFVPLFGVIAVNLIFVFYNIAHM